MQLQALPQHLAQGSESRGVGAGLGPRFLVILGAIESADESEWSPLRAASSPLSTFHFPLSMMNIQSYSDLLLGQLGVYLGSIGEL